MKLKAIQSLVLIYFMFYVIICKLVYKSINNIMRLKSFNCLYAGTTARISGTVGPNLKYPFVLYSPFIEENYITSRLQPWEWSSNLTRMNPQGIVRTTINRIENENIGLFVIQNLKEMNDVPVTQIHKAKVNLYQENLDTRTVQLIISPSVCLITRHCKSRSSKATSNRDWVTSKYFECKKLIAASINVSTIMYSVE